MFKKMFRQKKATNVVRDLKREVIEQHLQRCKDAYAYSEKLDPVAAGQWRVRMEMCVEILRDFDTVDLLQI